MGDEARLSEADVEVLRHIVGGTAYWTREHREMRVGYADRNRGSETPMRDLAARVLAALAAKDEEIAALTRARNAAWGREDETREVCGMRQIEVLRCGDCPGCQGEGFMECEVRAEERAVAHVALTLGSLLRVASVTQRELATRLGLTEGRVSQLLSGNANPTVRTLSRIAHALGFTMRISFAASSQISPSTRATSDAAQAVGHDSERCDEWGDVLDRIAALRAERDALMAENADALLRLARDGEYLARLRAREERTAAVIEAALAWDESPCDHALCVALSDAVGRVRALDATPGLARGPSGVAPWQVPLWDAINDYATACGGDPSSYVYGNTTRQRAVAAVNRVVDGAIADHQSELASGAESDRLRAALAMVIARGGAIRCECCGRPATCVGDYEMSGIALGCDECCGHGNEDGWCERIAADDDAPDHHSDAAEREGEEVGR